MTNKIRIIVADDQPMIREGLRISLERSGQIEIVAEAEDGYAATLAVNTQKPDLVILDSNLRKLETYDAIARIRSQNPGTRILLMVVNKEMFEIQAFLELGVAGFIAKSALPLEYLNAVQALIGGGTYFSNSLVSSFFVQKRAGLTNANVFGLTSRETEILRFICSGFSNKDIARRFQLSVRTVETHRLNIRKKTNAVRLRDLVNVGKQLGLVEPEITRMVEPPRLALV